MAVIEVAVVASRLGLDPAELTPAQNGQIVSAIAAAEAKVVAYLGRPLVPSLETVEDLWPEFGYDLQDYRAWPQAESRFGDVYIVSSVTAGTSSQPGFYDVTFQVGLDVAMDPALAPIAVFITEDAAAALRLDPAFADAVGGRAVTSVSADGQSVTYEKATGLDTLGAGMSLSMLNRWRRRAAYQRPSRPFTPWPYMSGYGR